MCLATCCVMNEHLLGGSDTACRANLLVVFGVAFNYYNVGVLWGYMSVEFRSVLDSGFEMLSCGGGCGKETTG